MPFQIISGFVGATIGALPAKFLPARNADRLGGELMEGYAMSADSEAERQFWLELEFRVSREMQKPKFKKLFLWCDGFNPEQYFLNETPVRIVGSAWIIGGAQQVWKFTLSLALGESSQPNIDWAQLLPTPESGGWLFVTPAAHELEVKLAVVAHP